MAPAASDSTVYDVVIVGGGITGAGVARDAALRGMKVALFEKDDFASGTSSKSSKLVHGGLRYLELGEVGLVFESVSERYVQSRMAPHLVRPQPFLVPVFKDSRWGINMMSIGLWIYDALALFRAPRAHKTYRGRKARELLPELSAADLTGVVEYYDCFTDDARLSLENVLDAQRSGATCESHTRVCGVTREQGRVHSVTVRDKFSGETRDVRTHSVVLATGPWTDELVEPLSLDVDSRLLRLTKGVHLVFPREKLPLKKAVTLISPVDGRVMFAIPWRDRLVLGTTDTDFAGPADDVYADAADAKYLCDSANEYFPDASFAPSDAISTWAGLRPLVRAEGQSASSVSREHQLRVLDDGIVLVAGGKLTTYRLMAKEIVDETVDWLRDRVPEFRDKSLTPPGTKRRPLPGANEFQNHKWEDVEALATSLVQTHKLPEKTASHLAWTYGSRSASLASAIARAPELGEPLQPDLPYVWAEVEFAVQEDLAKTLCDVLVRRIPLSLVGRDQGLDVAEKINARMADLLDWNAERAREELAAYQAHIETTRRFRG